MAWPSVPKTAFVRLSPQLGATERKWTLQEVEPPRGLRPLGTWPWWGLLNLGVLALSPCLIPQVWTTVLSCVPVRMYSSKQDQSNRIDWHGLEPSKLWIQTKLSFLSCFSQILCYSNDLKLLLLQSYGWKVELSFRLHSCLASLLYCPAPDQGVSST